MTKILRSLLLLIFLISVSGCRAAVADSPGSPAAPAGRLAIQGQRLYNVTFQMTIANHGPRQPEKQNIWVALIRDRLPYQQVPSMQVSPEKYQRVVDEYGNQYAEFDFSGQPGGITQTVTIAYRVVVNELAYDLSTCQGPLLDQFTQPELHIEADNPQIKALASQLSQGKSSICQQVRAFYDYLGDHLIYTSNGLNWGAQAALGKMGSDCTEYTDLMVALSRAQGIPARYYEGLLYLDQASASLAKVEHAWPDVYLPGVGWTAMDPTLGRFPISREAYFAHYSPNHIIVTQGVSPSVLRGSSYWTYLYWPGNNTSIRVNAGWKIEPIANDKP